MSEFLVENGRVFIEGKETIDPLLIGYKIIDLIESGRKISIDKSIPEVFNERDQVYIINDIEQHKRTITGVYIGNESVIYYLTLGTEVSKHYAYEISKQKSYENI